MNTSVMLEMERVIAKIGFLRESKSRTPGVWAGNIVLGYLDVGMWVKKQLIKTCVGIGLE